MKKGFDPLFRRENVIDLCGEWEFSFDNVRWQKINVPYCPESRLSGVHFTDFIPKCYYRKRFSAQSASSRVFLRFGAVDYECKAYLNGKYVGGHKGGYTPFEFDVTEFVSGGENVLELQVLDEEYLNRPTGKQSYKRDSFGCFYTRTTGIWQPVWLEYRPDNHLQEVRFYPDVDRCAVTARLRVSGKGNCAVEVFFEGKFVGAAQGYADGEAEIVVALTEKHLWNVAEGRLYDVKITVEEDVVYSYFGLRKAEYKDMRFLLNGKEVYQKLVLDQGFNVDGVYTEPSVEFMRAEIESALALGFNGLRLHQKVFDPRFLALCDEMGVMVWGEFASWGVNYSDLSQCEEFLSQWREVLQRDFNHPCIVTWCPLNEVWDNWTDKSPRDVRFVDAVYDFTKKSDPTRPCVDASGGHHGHKTDLFDFHCYEDVGALKKHLDDLEQADRLDIGGLYGADKAELYYAKDLPVNASEIGGFSLAASTEAGVEGLQTSSSSWGYGKGAENGDAFVDRYRRLIDAIGECKKVSGFCYTQLYDVEQEQNGFYRYDRSDKLTEGQKAAIKSINDAVR